MTDRARQVYEFAKTNIGPGREVFIQTGRQVGRVRSLDDIRLIDNGHNLSVRHGKHMLCHLGPQIARAWASNY